MMLHCGNRRSQMKPSRRQHGPAFTLAEVALALGIVAIGMAAIVGLLGVASTTTRSSDIDTMVSAISRRVISELQAMPFDSLWLAEPTAGVMPGATTLAGAPEDSVFYFTAQGILLRAGENVDEAAYVCRVRKIPDERTKDFVSGRANLLQLQLLIHWPASAKPRSENTRTFRTQMARY